MSDQTNVLIAAAKRMLAIWDADPRAPLDDDLEVMRAAIQASASGADLKPCPFCLKSSALEFSSVEDECGKAIVCETTLGGCGAHGPILNDDEDGKYPVDAEQQCRAAWNGTR